MRRRKFIQGIAALAAWSLAARAQHPAATRRIGVLMAGVATDALPRSFEAAFVQGLKELGWIEGQNAHIDVRWNPADTALARTYAAQLVGLQPDVILADTTKNLESLREATSTVPIVFVRVSDPVEQGFVANMIKPGGIVTGFSAYDFSTGGKWVELLKEAVPQLVQAAVLFNPDTAVQSKFFIRAIKNAASSLKVQTVLMSVRNTADMEQAVMSFAQKPNRGLILPTDTFVRLNEHRIADLALLHRLPVICFDSEFPKAGGLMSYSVDINYVTHFRQAAGYVDRILKGANAGELPVQRPDRYKLVINLKTANLFGLTIPLSLAGLADEVIE